jgi:hypothetical protein
MWVKTIVNSDQISASKLLLSFRAGLRFETSWVRSGHLNMSDKIKISWIWGKPGIPPPPCFGSSLPGGGPGETEQAQKVFSRIWGSHGGEYEDGCLLGCSARWVLIALTMEAARTSETSVNVYQTTRRYNPEDSHLQKVLLVDSICRGFFLLVVLRSLRSILKRCLGGNRTTGSFCVPSDSPLILSLHFILPKTEHHDRVVNTPASYLGCPGFKSRPRFRLSWQAFRVFRQSPQINVRLVP